MIEFALSEASGELGSQVFPSEEQNVSDVGLLDELPLCYPIELYF